MATFKVGDRVRIVNSRCGKSIWIGKEGAIWKIEPGGWCRMMIARGMPPDAMAYSVCIDGVGELSPKGFEIAFEAHNLAPLSDPKADEFVERIRKMKPEPEIVAPRVTEDIPAR